MKWSTFGELRAFIHSGTPSFEAFTKLFDAMMASWAHMPEEIEHQWLPYAIEHLNMWPDSARALYGGVDWSGDSDRFCTRSHPLYQMIRTLDVETDQIEAYLNAPDIQHLTALTLTAEYQYDMSPEALGHLLGQYDETWGLKHFGLILSWDKDEGFGDEHAEVLAHCKCLSTLESLNLGFHTMTGKGLERLGASPYLKHLKRFTMGDVPSALGWTVEAKHYAKLHEQLPDVEIILNTPGTPTLDEPRKTYAPTTLDTKSNLMPFLETYKDLEGGIEPIFAPFFDCYSTIVELTPEQFEDDTLTAQALYPGADDILEAAEYSRISVLGMEPDVLEWCFNDKGELVRPLTFRPFAVTDQCPDYRNEASYQSQPMVQMNFALRRLNLWEDERGWLHLDPETCHEPSDLINICQAIREVEQIWGGQCVEFLCWSWHHHPNNGLEEQYDYRLILTWQEEQHNFDRFGNLSGGRTQPISLIGDMFPLFHILPKYNLSLDYDPAQNTFCLSSTTT